MYLVVNVAIAALQMVQAQVFGVKGVPEHNVKLSSCHSICKSIEIKKS